MIFKDLAEFKKYTTVQKNTSWETLSQFVQTATQRFLTPIIGEAQYSALILEINALPNTSEEYVILIDHARQVVANGAMYLGYPRLWVTEGDMGVHQNRSREGTSEPATNTAYFEARRSYLDSLTYQSEALLQYLQSEKSSFAPWATSRNFTEYNTLFIRNNRELGQFLNTHDSIRAYTGIRPFIELSEQKYVEPIVPTETLIDLRNRLKNNTLSEVESKIINKIRKAVAWFSLYEALPFINVKMEGTAISIAIIQDGITKHNMPTEKDKERLSRMAFDNAQLFYKELVDSFKPASDDFTPQYEQRLCNHNKPDFWV